MPRKPEQPRDDPAQSKRFVETAKELEADETKEAFDRAFGRVTPKSPDRSEPKAP